MKKKSLIILTLNLVLICFLTTGTTTAQIAFNGQENEMGRRFSIKTENLILFDKIRSRFIPVALYAPVSNSGKSPAKLKLSVLNHGYGIKNTEYSFVTETLVAYGYVVASVQHELPSDERMPTDGNSSVVRRPFWERGVQNILFLTEKIKRTRPGIDSKNLLIVGHSNGGDTAMLFAAKYPEKVKKIISLDNRRTPIPRTERPQILSIRSSDQTADEVVLPTVEEQEKFRIKIVKLADTVHNDMWDGATAEQKREMSEIISDFLADRTQNQSGKHRISDLKKTFKQIAENARGRVGAAEMLLKTGESIWLSPKKRFLMQSVFKLPVAMAVLRQVDTGKIKLDQRVRVERSDLVGKNLLRDGITS